MLSTIQRSWNLLTARQKTGLTVLSVVRVSVNFLDILGITLIGIAVTVLLGNIDSVSVLNWLPSPFRDSPPTLLIVTAVVFLLKTTLGILLARETAMFLARVEAYNSNRVTRSVFSRGLAESKSLSRSEIEWVVLRSTGIAFSGVLLQAMTFLAEASLAIFVFSLMLATDWAATLTITVYFLFILSVFHWFSGSKFQSAGSEMSRASVSVTQSITDLVNAFREISVLKKTDYFLSSLARKRLRVAQASAKVIYLQAIPRLLIETALIVGALAFLSWQTSGSNDDSSYATLAILLMGSLRIMSALLPLQRSFAEIRFNRPQAEGAHALLEKYPHSESANQVEALATGAARPDGGLRVELLDVRFAFDDQPKHKDHLKEQGNPSVVDGVSMVLEAGSYIALIGPSGAGKSTLIDLLLGLYQPSSGDVLVEGLPAQEFFSLHPGTVGYVPQRPGIVCGTVAQNVALGVKPSEIDYDAVWTAIQSAQLEDYVLGLPDGVYSDLGTQNDSLSGGQKQRLGLARALYASPKLLVLDEATSGLDAQTESSVTESLMALRGKVTMIVVAHRLSTVQNVDVAHVLVQGKILASGSFSELRRKDPLVKRYVELMSFSEE